MAMTIAEDMNKLTENIIISNDVRVKALGELVADTHKTLKGFAGDRKKMAAEQAKDLANFVNGLSKNVQSFLGNFQKDHHQMSKEQAKSLNDFVVNLTDDVESMLDGFQKARNEMSEELKDRLAKEVKEIETYVANKLKEFDNAHADMSEELKKDLDKYVGGIVSETRKFLKECGSDMAQAKKAWKNMSATLAKARKGGVMPRIESGEKVSTVGQAIGKGKGAKRAGKKSSRQTVDVGI
jgi:gas vesicle protein